MPLTAGQRLGPYEIVYPIGAGGMGEVYQATDTKLDRQVAIKTLPDEFAQDEQRLARFEREAKLLASLNHPRIGAIYGLEESEGKRFLVLELIEGDTLADRLKRGPIPVEESLELALQMAEALEAAHDAGVIHRDLKPANVKVKEDGMVKVLDFGLAKALEGGEDGSQSESPTLTAAATRAGVIMGTAAYMSPEQAKGKIVDKRADIWGFGVVLFEMLTAKRLFEGEDVSETLAAVLRAEPDWNALPADTPPAIRRLLRRALHRDRRDRLGDMTDARLEIEEARESPASDAEAPPGARTLRVWQRPLPLVLASLMLGAVVARLLPTFGAPAPPRVTRYALALPETDEINVSGGLAWSPDGRYLAYPADRTGVRQLFLRARDQLEPIPISGTEGALHPFFSPDGQWIGFFADDNLKKVSVAGGPPVTLCPAGLRLGASWGPDDTIVFASISAPGLWQVPAAGGEPKPLTTPDPSEGRHNWPEFLPDGRAVLFTISKGGPVSDKRVAVLSLDSGETQILLQGTDAGYAPSGHLVFGREASLWAVPFDPDRLEVTGTPAPMVKGVQVNALGGWALYALGPDGSLAYRTGQLSSASPTAVDREGAATPLSGEPHRWGEPRFSPDGRRIALEADEDIWILDVARGTLSRLTVGGGQDPVWTPDGSRVAYVAEGNAIFWKPADGSGDAELLTRTEHLVRLGSWSPDGQELIFTVNHPSTRWDIWVLPRGGQPSVFLATPFGERRPELSPDGRWLLYQSDESGRHEVYLQPYPGPGQRVPVSTAGGREPSWSRDGHELFYRDLPGDLTVVSFDSRAEPPVGRPRRLLERGIYRTSGTGQNRFYDVSRDGERFVMLAAASSESRDIHVVLNWLEELKERVPVP